jgi:two-component system cell cycle sensor histidine kinase/response regulator CckA
LVRRFDCAWRTKTNASRDALAWVELFNLGQEPYLLMIVQDITERKKLEERLRQAQKMEAVGQLAAGVAHDFNNILTVIQGHASLRLATDNLDHEIAESLKEVSTAAERATRLTRQLLAFSRRQVIRRKPLDLNALIHELSKMVCRLIGEHIQLRCELQPDLPLICADENTFEQVIINLAVNARDAMPSGGSLTLHTAAVTIEPNQTPQHPEAEAGRFVRLSVIDTGCGIAPDIRGRIFEPFFTTKGVGKGTGMGLAMVYGIIKQHGGWIDVQSQTAAGARFEVYLPVHDKPQRASSPSPATALPALKALITQRAAAPSLASGGREVMATVLVVEDEPSLQDLVKSILQRCGYHLLLANNGVEALQVWRDHQGKIDLLLTDMVMPEGISGQQLAEQLLHQNPRLKVIYSSGYTSELIDNPGEMPDKRHFLPKPYHPHVLIEAVRACLAS